MGGFYWALLPAGRGWKRPLRVCKSDVPEGNLTLSLLFRSRTVVESKVRGLSFHLLYQRPFFVIVETNAGGPAQTHLKGTRVSHCGPRGGETLKGEPQGCARRRSPHGGAVRMAGADAATGALVQGVRGISCAGRAAPASVPASLAAHTPSLHTAVAATATAATVPGVAIATIVTAEMIATAAAATSRAPARTRTPCCSRVSTWASRAWVQMGLRASQGSP